MSKDDPGKRYIRRAGAIKGAGVGTVAAGAITTAASGTVAAAAAGTTTSLTVGAGFAPFVSAIGAAKVASLPAIVVALANPVGAAVATGALVVGGAALGYKLAKKAAEKL